MTTPTNSPAPVASNLVPELEKTFEQSTLDFARAYYLFATAKLSETYNSQEIYAKYPRLHSEETFQQIKALYDKDPGDEVLKRLFTEVLGTYIGNQLSEQSDAYQNKKNALKIDVSSLGLKNADGSLVTELLYEDTPEWMKKLEDKKLREALYELTSKRYTEEMTPLFIELFHAENQLFADLGYFDLIAFYSQTSGHNLLKLGEKAKQLIEETQALYDSRIQTFYKKRTGENFKNANRADISYVFHGPDPETAVIDAYFPEASLVPLAVKTFDGMGLGFSTVAETVDFKSMDEFNVDVVEKTKLANGNLKRILLDISKRDGKRSRAYVYPAKVPEEIYLSVKPEGGLYDYSAFFHESGHAQHFANTNPSLGYARAQMGNNTVTEAYAYLLQNLFLNRHWLQHQAGLTQDQALQVVQRGALNDLYMLRRYASKMRFELVLFEGDTRKGISLTGKDKTYGELLTQGTGFFYDADGWSRDVDAGFYVADYFTAWALEAQLREYLATHFCNSALQGEDWYANPEAGKFLKSLWRDGNLTQQDLSDRLGYHDPTDVGPLLRLMNYNLD